MYDSRILFGADSGRVMGLSWPNSQGSGTSFGEEALGEGPRLYLFLHLGINIVGVAPL